MTEVPEHILERSRLARARLTGADPGASSAPVPVEDTTAAPTAAQAAAPVVAEDVPPPPPPPKPPWVQAAERTPPVPIWAAAMLAFLPIWAIMYMTTNDPESPKELGPLVAGAAAYGTCAGCHGGGGGGGAGPALNGGAVVEEFPDIAQQVRWVMLGTAGYEDEGTATYGANEKPVGGGGAMPAQASLEDTELLGVIRHEREVLSAEEFNKEAWTAAMEELADDPNEIVSSRAAGFLSLVEEWPEG